MAFNRTVAEVVEILDCTLRDGSYAVDFSFTASETHDISKALNDVGVPYIEIGHGVGIGAQGVGFGKAAATDAEYMRHAVGNWGVFLIPNIGSLSNLDEIKEAGGKFVRIGCDVDNVECAEPFIQKAKKLGLYVFSNIMKSYALDDHGFAEEAAKCVDYGADCVYIVDSAGCMTPDQIHSYADWLRSLRPEVKLGFHGHNNLGLAVANSWHAANIGFDVVDTTLCGIGRGAGNAPTEQLLALLYRCGYSGYTQADILKTMDIGEKYIRHIAGTTCPTQLDIVSGMAGFHSSYMPKVLQAAKEYRVDPRRIITKLANVSLVNVTHEMVDAVAKNVAKSPFRMETRQYIGGEQD